MLTQREQENVKFWKFVCCLRCVSIVTQTLCITGVIWTMVLCMYQFTKKTTTQIPQWHIGLMLDMILVVVFLTMFYQHCKNAPYRDISGFWIFFECFVVFALLPSCVALLMCWTFINKETILVVPSGAISFLCALLCLCGWVSSRRSFDVCEKEKAKTLFQNYGLARVRPLSDKIIFGSD